MKNDKYLYQFLADENYRVCSSGQIFSRYSRQGHLTPVWRELRQVNNDRYKHVVYANKKLPVHRLVAAAFIGKIPAKHQVNHKDGNPCHNDIRNLEIVTQSQNNFHRFRTLCWPPVLSNKKLSAETADQIREDKLALGLSHNALAAKYCVSKTTISYIITNKIWK